MRLIFALIFIVALLWLIDRVGLFADSRGWITWRTKRTDGKTAAGRARRVLKPRPMKDDPTAGHHGTQQPGTQQNTTQQPGGDRS